MYSNATFSPRKWLQTLKADRSSAIRCNVYLFGAFWVWYQSCECDWGNMPNLQRQTVSTYYSTKCSIQSFFFLPVVPFMSRVGLFCVTVALYLSYTGKPNLHIIHRLNIGHSMSCLFLLSVWCRSGLGRVVGTGVCNRFDLIPQLPIPGQFTMQIHG